MEGINLQEEQRNLFITLAEAFSKQKDNFVVTKIQQESAMPVQHRYLNRNTKIHRSDLDDFRSAGLINFTSSNMNFNITSLGMRYYEHLKRLTEEGSTTMSHDEITTKILSAIRSLSNDDIYTNVGSEAIVKATNIPEKDLELYARALAKRGLTKIEDYQGGFDVSITAEGILFLKNPAFITSQSSTSSINIQNVSNSIINIESSLNQANQRIESSKIEDTAKQELVNLLDQLKQQLKAANTNEVDHDDIEAVAESANDLADAVSKDKPNNRRIKITRDGLEQAAKNIKDVMPEVLLTVTQIINFVQRIFP